MQQPTIFEIDQIRNAGFRPQIVGCFLNNKKILFLYMEKHKLWQFPQGGIDNNEDMAGAFFREISEELGDEFAKSYDKNILLFYGDKVEFPKYSQNSRELKNDAGQNIFMKGKKYFFICAEAKVDNLKISNSQFDDFKWVLLEEGLVLCDKIEQPGKKRIMIGALNELKKLGLL